MYFKIFQLIHRILRTIVLIDLKDFEDGWKWYHHYLPTVREVCLVQQLLYGGRPPIFLAISAYLSMRLFSSLCSLFVSSSLALTPLGLWASPSVCSLLTCGVAMCCHFKSSFSFYNCSTRAVAFFNFSSISDNFASIFVVLISRSQVACDRMVVGM